MVRPTKSVWNHKPSRPPTLISCKRLSRSGKTDAISMLVSEIITPALWLTTLCVASKIPMTIPCRHLYSCHRLIHFPFLKMVRSNILRFCKFPVGNFFKRKASLRYTFTESFSITGCFVCPVSYLVLQ